MILLTNANTIFVLSMICGKLTWLTCRLILYRTRVSSKFWLVSMHSLSMLGRDRLGAARGEGLGPCREIGFWSQCTIGDLWCRGGSGGEFYWFFSAGLAPNCATGLGSWRWHCLTRKRWVIEEHWKWGLAGGFSKRNLVGKTHMVVPPITRGLFWPSFRYCWDQVGSTGR